MNETRPVKVGDVLNVKIEAVGEKGDGIAKKDGFVLFVPNTSEGDEVKVRVTKVLRRVGFAELVGSADSSAPQSERAPREAAPPADEDSEDFGEEPEDQSMEGSEDLKESDSVDDDLGLEEESDEDLEDSPGKKSKH